jgi:uncharacterized protein (DUF2062 family)
MFKRRSPLNPAQQLKEMIWPSMGWDRAYYYFRHRLFRNADSAHKISGGLSLGMAVSFTPFLGTHLLQAIFFAWLFRFNVVAAVIGTLGGNWWTFPAMFWLDYVVGSAIFNALGVDELIAMPETMTLQFLFENPLKLLLPLTLGGIICAILSWPVCYVLLYWPVRGMRRAYRYQRLRLVRARRQLKRRSEKK